MTIAAMYGAQELTRLAVRDTKGDDGVDIGARGAGLDSAIADAETKVLVAAEAEDISRGTAEGCSLS